MKVAGERRRFGRRQTFKHATAVLEDRRRLPCSVVNMSEGGALLQVREPEALDDVFDLVIPEDNIQVSCRIAHRTAGRIGVAFSRSPRFASRLSETDRAHLRHALEVALSDRR